MKKQRVVVVCPGRGSYTDDSLGYLAPFSGTENNFLRDIDTRRAQLGLSTISSLDHSDDFSTNIHNDGVHAAPLIYACSFMDFQMINREKFEIVAITGNSMGWYVSLALAGCLDWASAYRVIQVMGSQMRDRQVGEQIICSLTDSEWNLDPKVISAIEKIFSSINGRNGMEIYESIFLGGKRIYAGNRPAISAFNRELSMIGRNCIRIQDHSAFHTPMLDEVSFRAFSELPKNLFKKLSIPVIDGRGRIWNKKSEIHEIYKYTLGHQIVKPFDFTAAISTAVNKFLPDKIILLGPGKNLVRSIGQILIQQQWKNLNNRRDFLQLQKNNPVVLAMDNYHSQRISTKKFEQEKKNYLDGRIVDEKYQAH